jgi:hypothetical protein
VLRNLVGVGVLDDDCLDRFGQQLDAVHVGALDRD